MTDEIVAYMGWGISAQEQIDGFRKEVRELKAENAKLRELCKSMRCALVDSDDKVYLAALDDTLVGAGFDLQELGIEATVK